MYDVHKGHKRNFKGHYTIRVTEAVRPLDGYELVIVPTRHYQLLSTLGEIVPRPGDAGYLLHTQNWEGTEALDAILPPARCV